MSFIVSPGDQITAIPVPASQGGTGLIASGLNGNVLQSDGTTWISAPASGAQGFITQSTGSNQPPGNFVKTDDFALI